MKGGKKPTISSPFENLEIDKILKWTEEQVLGTKFYVPKIVSKS